MDIQNQLTPEELLETHTEILEDFKPIEGFDLEDYYGVAWMSKESTDGVQIRLQYSYKTKNPKNGSPKSYAPDQIDDALFDLQVLLALRKRRASVETGLSARERLKQRREEKGKDASPDFPGT